MGRSNFFTSSFSDSGFFSDDEVDTSDSEDEGDGILIMITLGCGTPSVRLPCCFDFKLPCCNLFSVLCTRLFRRPFQLPELAAFYFCVIVSLLVSFGIGFYIFGQICTLQSQINF